MDAKLSDPQPLPLCPVAILGVALVLNAKANAMDRLQLLALTWVLAQRALGWRSGANNAFGIRDSFHLAEVVGKTWGASARDACLLALRGDRDAWRSLGALD